VNDRSNAKGVTLAELQSAVTNRELVFHFQPKISMVYGTLCGAGLIRWGGRMGRSYRPGRSSPWRRRRVDHRITLDMLDESSRRELLRGSIGPRRLVQRLGGLRGLALRRKGDPAPRCGLLHPDRLGSSSPETAVLAADRRWGAARHVRARGLSLAMDDLNRLVHRHAVEPLTTTVDRGRAAHDGVGQDATIVESASGWRTAWGRRHGRIETESLFAQLQGAGCSIGQGYWMRRPAALDDLIELSRSGRRWPAGALGLVHMAMLDHLDWRKSLVDALLSAPSGDAAVAAVTFERFVIEPTECRLGRWYHGPGRELAGLEAFRELEAPHEALHECGRHIVSSALGGARFHELVTEMRELTQHSTAIIGRLQDLEHAVLVRLAEGERTRLRHTRSSQPVIDA
jgi:hypothetical protein